MSFANLQLYSSTLPSYDSHKSSNGKAEKVINGDDPAMNTMIDKLIG